MAVLPESNDSGLREYLRKHHNFTEIQMKNMLESSEDASKRLALLSSQNKIILAPKGTGHMFPYDDPDSTLDVVRNMINKITLATSAIKRLSC